MNDRPYRRLLLSVLAVLMLVGWAGLPPASPVLADGGAIVGDATSVAAEPPAPTGAATRTEPPAGAAIRTAEPAAQTAAAVRTAEPRAQTGAVPRVLSAEDTLRFTSVGSAAISPDDQWVLYTESVRDMDDDELERTTHIWRVRIDGSQRRQLTHGDRSAGSPAWFPDGSRIAFTRSAGGGNGDDGDGDSQVFFMHVDGGEAWQATEHEGGVSSFAISPDGARLLFTARDPLSEEEEKRRKDRDDAEVVDARFRMTHLWVLDVDSGEERRLTEGDFTVTDPQWSPDSTRIAYVTRPTPKVDDGSYTDVFVADVASGESRKLYENAGPDSSPRWSPGGDTIAFSATHHVGNTQWFERLYLIPAAGGEPRILLEGLDLPFTSPIWAPDGERIYWSAGEKTTSNLFSVELSSGEFERHAPPRGSNGGWEMSHDGSRWVWSHSDPDSPGDLYTAGLDLRAPVRLTDSNPWLYEEEVELARVETVRWQNSEGQTIEGVLTYPVGYDPARRYPLILNPHGGPSGAVTESFSSTNHFFAGNGFMVLQPNFRGSSNYGQEFLNANRDNWGIRDYDDCMTGVDWAIEQGLADPDRLLAYGWSYGGYMTFWISTQTDRFKVISPGAGLTNLYSMYSTTDIPRYLGWFFGTPWDNEDIYRRLSPIRHVKNVSSKILIMHGANDARVPPEQAVEFYQALTDLEKDVVFVRYPRQGHGIGEPRLAMDRMRRYLYTFAAAVGIEPISEREWEQENPERARQLAAFRDAWATTPVAGPGAALPAAAETSGDSTPPRGRVIDVDLPPSTFDPLLLEQLDPGIFQILEARQ